MAYYIVPSPIGIIYCLVAQSAVAVAWMDAVFRQRIWLAACEITLLFFGCYIVWWFATGQKFVYP